MSVDPAFVDRLLRVTEEQAEASGRLAVLQQQNVENTTAIRMSMERMVGTLERIERDQREGREQAVEFLKERIETAAPKAHPLIGWVIAAAAGIGAAALAALATLRAGGVQKPD